MRIKDKVGLEDQVTSLEFSEELKKLGVKQNSLFAWYQYSGSVYCEYREHQASCDAQSTYQDGYAKLPVEICAAFTVAEHGEALPFNYTALKHISMEKWFGVEFFMGGFAKSIDIDAKTEADARAKIRIYLIKEGIIKVNKK